MVDVPVDNDTLLVNAAGAAGGGVGADETAIRVASAVEVVAELVVVDTEAADEHDGRGRETKRAWGLQRRGSERRENAPWDGQNVANGVQRRRRRSRVGWRRPTRQPPEMRISPLVPRKS